MWHLPQTDGVLMDGSIQYVSFTSVILWRGKNDYCKWIETHWNTPGAFLHAQTTNSFPLLNLYFTELFIVWRVRVMPLNLRNTGNNSCPTQGKIWNKCTKKSLNPLKITGHSTFIGNNYREIKWIVLIVLPLSLWTL